MPDKMLDRISKVLNQAERAEEGSPEREAFMEKAIELSQAHSIDLALARSHQANKEKIEEPETRDYKVGQTRSAGGMTPKGRNAHLVDLFLAVAEANDLECLISQDNVYVWAFGMPSDHEVASRTFAVLSVQMVTEADAALKRGDNRELQVVPKQVWEEIPEDERAWGKHDGSGKDGESHVYDEQDEEIRVGWHGGKSDVPLRQRYNERTYHDEWVLSKPPPKTRLVNVLDDDGQPVMEERRVATTNGAVWREEFYSGFVSRIRIRLSEARARARKEAGIEEGVESEKGLALVDKAEAIKKGLEEEAMFVLANERAEKGASGYGGAASRGYDHAARAAGDQAGTRAATGGERAVSG